MGKGLENPNTIVGTDAELAAKVNSLNAEVSALRVTSTPVPVGAFTTDYTATPLDQVEMDGEKAYREWLDAQKPNRILPPEKTTSEPSLDQPPS